MTVNQKEQTSETTNFHEMMINIINLHQTSTKSIYYMLFGEWPKHDCLPEFKKSLWSIIASIDHGDEFCEFLDLSGGAVDVRLGNSTDTYTGVFYYTEHQLDMFVNVIVELKKTYNKAIYMMYRLPLGDQTPDYVLAEFASTLLNIIAEQQRVIRHMYDNLHTMAQSGQAYDPNNPLTWDIEEFELSVRSYNCLKRAGINTAIDLVKKTPTEFRKIRNFGEKSQKEVLAILKSYNLKLTPD